jgi:hypothetical protein
MDQKLMVSFEVKKNDRTYALHIPSGAPLGEVYDSLHEMLMEVSKLSTKSAENAKRAEEVAIEPERV